VPIVSASCYGHGLWFWTKTPLSSANGSQRARCRQSLSDPASMGKSQTRAVWSRLAVTTRASSGLNAASVT